MQVTNTTGKDIYTKKSRWTHWNRIQFSERMLRSPKLFCKFQIHYRLSSLLCWKLHIKN